MEPLIQKLGITKEEARKLSIDIRRIRTSVDKKCLGNSEDPDNTPYSDDKHSDYKCHYSDRHIDYSDYIDHSQHEDYSHNDYKR